MVSKKHLLHVITILGTAICLWLFGCYSRGQIQAEMGGVDTNSVGMTLLSIPGGTFEMGNPDPGLKEWDETPVHAVTISGFSMSETEVTLEQYRQFHPDFEGSALEHPYVVGVSWEDATAFCEWLSEKGGTAYRLPTEAEWEYACRAETTTPYWSGEEPPKQGTPNPWGLKNMHSGPREWCYDWYGSYSYDDLIDPVGPDRGITRVIRGGGDEGRAYHGRSFNRSGYGPAFRRLVDESEYEKQAERSEEDSLPGLAGLWYGRLNFERVRGFETHNDLDIDFKALGRISNTWAGRYSGMLVSPVTGEVTFHVYADLGAILEIDGETLVDWRGEAGEHTGVMHLVRGKSSPLTVSYFHEYGDESVLRVRWGWEGTEAHPIPEENLHHTWKQEIDGKEITDAALGLYKPIGFRVVRAPMPSAQPTPLEKPFIQQCVVQEQPMLTQGPGPEKPWFRRRFLYPMPPDNVPREETRLAGLHPGMMDHNHSPTLEVCPNGDLMFISYTSEREYEPEVSLMATRLRFGAAEWDMPEILVDFADVNDHAPCLYSENKTMFFLWGSAGMGGAYPFQWMTSVDNGANWSEPHFPIFVGDLGPHSRQPINTVFRDLAGTLYVPLDGEGQNSLLIASKDDGRTWYDTGGRTAGRHTTFAVLKDGRILGMGGKNTDIDGYMPKVISSDGGKTWEVGRTPFAALGSNQRPCIVRLRSGRLFFCGDFQNRDGSRPEGITESGSYVAMSEDDGESWHIKKLPGTLPHEADGRSHTLGYSVARQSPNGVIHITTTMNTPCLHFEINEAWILSEEAGFQKHDEATVAIVREFRRYHPSGRLKTVWRTGISPEGAYLLHGHQIWYYEDGSKHYEATYRTGHKIGTETLWDPEGRVVWGWEHDEDGTGVWTQYYSSGQKKSESTWEDFAAEGPAMLWTVDGELISDVVFEKGRIKP